MLHLLIALQTAAVQLPPPPRGYGTSTAEVVVDAAQVLPIASVDRINQIAFDVHAKSRGEIAVVTLPDIGLRAPVDIALGIGRAWGVGANAAIGQQSRNAGVVILVVPKETSSSGRGECFITTGQGTEGFITDAEAASICREAIPLFQRQQYGPALEYLTGRVAEEFAREFNFTLDSSSTPSRITRPDLGRSRSRSTGGLSPFAIFILFMVAYFILSSLGRRRRGCGGCLPVPIVFPTGGGYRRGGWGGGGFGGGGGGGFGGFGGGGGFSGGGGGSSW